MIPGPFMANPTHREAIPPASICPVAPILNNPALKAIATETPHKISGVELLMVFEMARSEPKDPTTRAQYALPTVENAPTMSPFFNLSTSETMMMKAPTMSAESTASSVSFIELTRFRRSPTLLNNFFMHSPHCLVVNRPYTDRLPLVSTF